jgi:MFS family permease
VTAGLDCTLIFAAKTARTFAYGFLGIVLPVYLSELGVGAVGIGAAITLTLLSSAALTWTVRRPAERYGARAALLGLVVLSALAAVLLLVSRTPWVVVVAAMLGNVAVGVGETGPFLTVEQVVVARATSGQARARTNALSVYNLVGYGSAAVGAAIVGLFDGYRPLFALFLAAAASRPWSTAACRARRGSSARPARPVDPRRSSGGSPRASRSTPSPADSSCNP